MKTGRELIELFEPEVKEKILTNVASQRDNVEEFLDEEFENRDDMLGSAFGWASSPEGRDYWVALIEDEEKAKASAMKSVEGSLLGMLMGLSEDEQPEMKITLTEDDMSFENGTRIGYVALLGMAMTSYFKEMKSDAGEENSGRVDELLEKTLETIKESYYDEDSETIQEEE